MTYRGRKLGDGGLLGFLCLFLLMMSWGQVIHQRNEHGERIQDWRADPVPRNELGGDVRALLDRGEPRRVQDVDKLAQDFIAAGEMLVATPDGFVTLQDTREAGEKWRVDLGEPVRSLTELEWDGDPSSREIAAGGERGKVVVLARDGQKLEEWDYWEDPVAQLLGADLDRDGREDLVAGMPSRLEIFWHDHPSLTVDTSEPLTALGARDDLLVVGAGRRVEAYRVVRNSWLEKYRPILGSLIFTLVVLLAIVPVVRLHPPAGGLGLSPAERAAKTKRTRI